ncbi:MAG TPA: hypothetical protein VN665_00235 [Candidatus Paceibacterota bacterium]|nr:hypothetical protein [Candidatus Paceibacterota bacterium]
MNASIVRTARFGALMIGGFALGMLALTLASATGAKSSFWNKLGISTASASGPVADNQCAVPKSGSDDVYFVSCGGFF